MTKEEVKSETGASEIEFDPDKQVIKLDFSGNYSPLFGIDKNECLRNDASIFYLRQTAIEIHLKSSVTS